MGLKSLYQKIDSFEASLSEKVRESSFCKKGCSRCCYVDLTIFSVEADHIREWFHSLSVEDQLHLIKAWESPEKESLNFQNEPKKSCAFLVNEMCTIYEVRPLICRTQGFPLKMRGKDGALVDVCPLNEEMLQKVSDKELLNLDIVNLILAGIEKLHSPDGAPRVSLSDLRTMLWTQSVKR